MMPQPRYEHDCRGCQLLGRVGDFDVYQCDHIDLILRYGHDGDQNKALPICIVRDHRKDDTTWAEAMFLYDERYPHAKLYRRTL